MTDGVSGRGKGKKDEGRVDRANGQKGGKGKESGRWEGGGRPGNGGGEGEEREEIGERGTIHTS